MKKLISILLALTVVGGVLAGCAAEGGDAAAPAKEGETTTTGDAAGE